MTVTSEEEPGHSLTCDSQVVSPGVGSKRVEGWLFLIATRRLRGPFPHKRYFVLEHSAVSWFKTMPAFYDEAPEKRGVIDPGTRVLDHGRETIHGQVLFVFTLHDSTEIEKSNQLKFGASSAEEAAKWMTAFKVAAERTQPRGKTDASSASSHGRRRLPFARKRGGSGLVNYVPGGLEAFPGGDDTSPVPDWTNALSFKETSPDVVVVSPWRIIGCRNGLRLFRETTDEPSFGLKNVFFKEDQPALMAVGVVDAGCEAVFSTAMALGPSRQEWDFCYHRGRVIEHIDGHTDIVHKQFHNNWSPWRMRPRDLVLRRYWRREDDGSYAILYQSVKHEKCRPRHGYVRATVKSGGYVISPLDTGVQSRSLVRHMITADWKVRQTCFQPSSEQDVTLRVLERVAAIREFYKTKPVDASGGRKALKDSPTIKRGQDKKVDHTAHAANTGETLNSMHTPQVEDSLFSQIGDGDELFYDVEEDAAWQMAGDDHEGNLKNQKEAEGIDEEDEIFHDTRPAKVTKISAAGIVNRLREIATSVKKNQAEFDEVDAETFSKVSSLPKASDIVANSCWDSADVDSFRIRGKNYLHDHQKVKAGEPWMQFIAADWFKSDKREDHLASRPSNVVQVVTTRLQRSSKSSKSTPPFFFVINLQVPGAVTHSLALYYMMYRRLEDDPLLESFVKGDDRFRNSRFKLIPHIAKGSWIVKQSVGKTACLIGEALTINYHTGSNYIELDVDIGSSSVARGVVNLVIGYLRNLVIEMAFLIQADTPEELPEHLLGTCRLTYLDMNKTVPAPAE